MRTLMLEYAGTEMHRVPWVEVANKLAEKFLGGKRDGKQCGTDPELVAPGCLCYSNASSNRLIDGMLHQVSRAMDAASRPIDPQRRLECRRGLYVH